LDDWVYAVAHEGAAPRSAVRYVDYDPQADIMASRRVSLGFGAATPRSLFWSDAFDDRRSDVLDRLKVRASARFFGFVPLGRDEDDIRSRYVAWRAGPVRVVRLEEKWVRLGFGLRTPIFRTHTTFYRSYAELPVELRLNYPPSYFFSAIRVRALLDFIDLRGWRLRAPGLWRGVVVGDTDREQRDAIARQSVDWVALEGPDLTIVLALDLGPTLRSLDRRILFRQDDADHSPEEHVGEMPGIGFSLTDWEDVDRGHHSFTATSYALPAAYDLNRFDRERTAPLQLTITPLP
jgi:hypothetical protein